jgi:hypothetical protein
MTWSGEAKLRNYDAELPLRYSRGRAIEAVSQCHSEAKGRRISKNDKKGVMTQPLSLCCYNFVRK